MRFIEVPTPDGFGTVKLSDDECKVKTCLQCGWIGKDLEKNVDWSHADTWYGRPRCGAESKDIDIKSTSLNEIKG